MLPDTHVLLWLEQASERFGSTTLITADERLLAWPGTLERQDAGA